MFGFFKRNNEEKLLREEFERINNITGDHSEKISDCAILINIVNNEDAQKVLPEDDFKAYMEKFKEIAGRREQLDTNRMQYQHRAFNIAYEIEMDTGIHYEDVCGDATDILYMYSNMKPKFDELVDMSISEYSGVIDDIIQKNPENNNARLCFRNWIYAIQYYVQSTAMVISAYPSLKNDYFTLFLNQVVHWKMTESVMMHFLPKASDEPVIQSWNQKMADMGREAMDNNETLEECLDRFTNTFLYLCGVPDDQEDKTRLLGILDDLKAIGESGI